MRERKVFKKDGLLHIRFDYDRELVNLVKGLPERRWNREDRCWTVPEEHVVAVVELLRDAGFVFDEDTLRLYKERRTESELTVSQLNLKVRNALYAAFPGPVWVVGEILGFQKSAHKEVVDFRLAERREDGSVVAEVPAVLFPDVRALIERKLERAGNPFRLEDELAVRVLVQVDLKVDWGEYRLIVQDLDVNYTLGEVARRREEIVRKLTKAGLIDKTSPSRFLRFPCGWASSRASTPTRRRMFCGPCGNRALPSALRSTGPGSRAPIPRLRSSTPWTGSGRGRRSST